MSEDRAAREGALGWGFMGCSLMGGLALPVWFLLTVAVMQVSPALNGLGRDEVVAPGLGDWSWGAWVAGQWLFVGLAAMAVLLGATWLVGHLMSRRARADRRRLDELVASDAVIDAGGWSASSESDET